MVNILFDVDGVLVHGWHSDPQYRRRWSEHLERDLGLSEQTFSESFISRAFKEKVITGQQGLHEALAETLPSIGFGHDPQILIDYWMEHDAVLNQDLMARVKWLSNLPDVRLFIATNQEHVRAAHLMEDLGLTKYFDDIFYSARFGVTKPDPAFYRKAQALLPDGPVVFFDDHQPVVDGAIAHGWEAHQFNDADDVLKSETVAALLEG